MLPTANAEAECWAGGMGGPITSMRLLIRKRVYGL